MGIEVDPTQVAETAKTMEAQAQEIDSTMRTLIGQLSNLPSAWQGRAAGTFTAAQQAWEAKSAAHRAKLNAVAETLGVASKNQGALEDANDETARKHLSAIQAGLG